MKGNPLNVQGNYGPAPEARSAFLDEACAADQSLRREVESLLAHDAEDGSTFKCPFLSPFFCGKVFEKMSLTAHLVFDIILMAAVCVSAYPRHSAKKQTGVSVFTVSAGLSSLALIWELLPDDAPSPDQTAPGRLRRRDTSSSSPHTWARRSLRSCATS